MFRFTLIAYLSLASVFRPALCAAAATHRLQVSACCRAMSTDQTVEHQTHKDCQSCSSLQARLVQEKHANRDQKSTPCDSPGDRCHCGKQFAIMTLATTSGSSHSIAGIEQSYWATTISNDVNSLPFDTKQVSLLAQGRHFARSGQEILRAYQIMRC